VEASSLSLLLAEDNEDDLFLIQRAMEQSRLVNPVHVVRDGEEVIEYLAGEGRFTDRAKHPAPMLLLLDLRMPKQDGFDVLRWIKSQHPRFARMKVVVLTGSPDERDLALATALGADSYFRKPGSLSEFVNLMLRIQGLALGRWPRIPGQAT
jgi:two-component system response regulator